MKQICKFNKQRDITPTNPALDPCHKQAIREGVVRDTSATAFYNMQKEIEEVGGRISDEFDFIEYDHAYRKYRKRIEDANKE